MSLQSFISELSRPVDHYCERTNAALYAEPINAISNVAFFIAAWAAWRLQKRYPNIELGRPIRALCLLIAVVGAGSLIFHTVATRWAEWVDVIPILIFMISYCWIALTAFFDWPRWAKVLATLLLFASTLATEAGPFDGFLWGGAMYLPTLVFMIVIGAGLWLGNTRGGRTFFVAALLFVVSFSARTLDMPICDSLPIGTHFIWHILNACVLYLLVRAVIVHTSKK